MTVNNDRAGSGAGPKEEGSALIEEKTHVRHPVNSVTEGGII